MKRLLALLLLLCLPASAAAEIFIGQEPPAEWAGIETLRVTLLQTGRSDAILVECGGEAMLIDGGDASWAAAVQHDLEKRGLTDFRYFLNTHPHNDHMAGLLWLLKQGYRPGRFMSPFAADWSDGSYHDEAVRLVWDAGIVYRLVRSGDVFPLGGARVTVYRTTEYTGVNDRSAIELIAFGDSRILLCADLTGNAQKSLLKLLEDGALKAEIVKAPHHGINAMVPEFLAKVDPSLILCTSAGADTPDLTRQAAARGLPLMHSGDGEIVLVTNGTDWYVVQHEKTDRSR